MTALRPGAGPAAGWGTRHKEQETSCAQAGPTQHQGVQTQPRGAKRREHQHHPLHPSGCHLTACAALWGLGPRLPAGGCTQPCKRVHPAQKRAWALPGSPCTEPRVSQWNGANEEFRGDWPLCFTDPLGPLQPFGLTPDQVAPSPRDSPCRPCLKARDHTKQG